MANISGMVPGRGSGHWRIHQDTALLTVNSLISPPNHATQVIFNLVCYPPMRTPRGSRHLYPISPYTYPPLHKNEPTLQEHHSDGELTRAEFATFMCIVPIIPRHSSMPSKIFDQAFLHINALRCIDLMLGNVLPLNPNPRRPPNATLRWIQRYKHGRCWHAAPGPGIVSASAQRRYQTSHRCSACGPGRTTIPNARRGDIDITVAYGKRTTLRPSTASLHVHLHLHHRAKRDSVRPQSRLIIKSSIFLFSFISNLSL